MDRDKEDKLKQEFASEDELISTFADKLCNIYDSRTAGDYTFHGVITDLLNKYDKLVAARQLPVIAEIRAEIDLIRKQAEPPKPKSISEMTRSELEDLDRRWWR